MKQTKTEAILGSIYLTRALNEMKETNNGKLRGGWCREVGSRSKAVGQVKSKEKCEFK